MVFSLFRAVCVLRRSLLFFLPLCAFCFSLSVSVYANTEDNSRPIRAVIITPNAGADFWKTVVEAAQIAAKDLSIDLTVYNFDSDRIHFLQIIHNITKQEIKPDIVLFNVMSEHDMIAFEKLNAAGINFIVFNTGLGEAKNREVGGPRGKYKHWIAQVVPNDIEVGKNMALDLYQEAVRLKGDSGKDLVYVSAVHGQERTIASDHRVQGLVLASTEHDNFILSAMSSGFWSSSLSYNAALRLLDQNTTPDVIWTAGDTSAMAVVKALEDKGLIPGKDVVTAGIDWDERIFDCIEDGRVYASYGGHFMDAAWALMLAYDYYHGNDFIDDAGVRIFTPLSKMDRHNLSQIRPALEQEKWRNINFKSLTKTHNPDFVQYDFNVLNHLRAQ